MNDVQVGSDEQRATVSPVDRLERNHAANMPVRASQGERVRIGSLPVDRLTFEQTLNAIERLVRSGEGGAVFTPNVDHVVTAHGDAAFQAAYERVDLSLADGQPVVWAARLLGAPVPEKISGSDLFLPLMKRAGARGWKVFLLGGAPGVAERGAKKLGDEEGVQVVGTAAPFLSVQPEPGALEVLKRQIDESGADLVIVGLGAPKQELWIDALRGAGSTAVLLGLGASLDFYIGQIQRAPRWMSDHGLEWLYRLSREPRRLWRRYLVRDPAFFLLVLRQLLTRSRAG